MDAKSSGLMAVAVCAVAVAGLGASACGGPGGRSGGRPVDCNANPTAPVCQDATGGGDTSGGDTSVDPGDTSSCTPDCAGKACGPNGCGGFCGAACGTGTTCVEGACVEGACGQGGQVVSGTFKVGGGIAFDKATITVEHKMDVDAFEDGCITSIAIDLGKGFGCVLHVEARGSTAPDGGLRIASMSFAADSQCPGFPDESEGEYTDFSGMKVMAVVPGVEKVTEANAPSACLTTNFEVRLEGTLRDAGGKSLNVAASTLLVSGEVPSTGSTTASCPCQASCDGKDCGGDGCGFECGVCDENEVCDGAGVCQCIPDCDGKECGDNGCGATCGACGEFEACEAGSCIACEPDCAGKECGDNGCGGLCGACEAPETCNDANQCACVPNCAGKECGSNGCGGQCGTCTGGETCNAQTGQCGCTPQCAGKECGNNGCGGQCGTCTGGETCETATGQCVAQTGECDGNGFVAVRHGAIDNTQNITYQGLNTQTGAFDALQIEFWMVQDPVSGQPVYPFESQSAYNIPNSNYSSCALCILLFDGCTADGSCAGATIYMATSGTLTVVSFADQAGETLEAVITDATLQEVTIDQGTAVSTPVPGGGQWCMESQVFIGPLTVSAPP